MKVTMLLFALLLFASSIASEYIGCFIDNSEDRDLPILQTDESDEPAPLSVESCVLMCAGDNWPYAGLQKDQCFCGATYRPKGKSDDSECRTKCAGDEETDDSKRQYCGGENRNSIYSTGASALGDALDQDDDNTPSASSTDSPSRPVVNLDFPTASTTNGAAPVDYPEDDPVDPFETVAETKLDDYKPQPTESGKTPVKPPVDTPSPKQPTPPTPKPTPPTPKPTPRPTPPAYNAKCPICPYKKAECGGPTRGNCNRRTGACECVNGRYGGACQGMNGNPGPDRYGTGNKGPVKCPVCPYKAAECGGPTRGDCNRQTGECVCKAGWSGGACSGRNGKVGIAAYNKGGNPTPRPAPKPQVLCPVCPYKKAECGGPTRGNCNRQTGSCECVNGWAGGACGGRNGKVGAAAYGIRPPSGQYAPAKCPVCPYKKEECGGPTRGDCNRQTAECVCKGEWSGGACSNRPGRPGAAGYRTPPRPTPPRPTPNYQDVKCPVCPYRHAECGGPNRGDCNKQTGECVCKTGYSGGACSNHGGRIGAAAYQTGKSTGKSTGGAYEHKCPHCPYRKQECGGPDRGTCNRQTGDCKCVNGWSGGACSGRNGKIGIAAYNRATLAEGANYSSTGSDNKMWITTVAVLGSVVLVLFIAVIALVVKLNSKEEERM